MQQKVSILKFPFREHAFIDSAPVWQRISALKPIQAAGVSIGVTLEGTGRPVVVAAPIVVQVIPPVLR